MRSGSGRSVFFVVAALLLLGSGAGAQRQMENLGRGMVAIHQGDGTVYVGWRLLGTDPDDIAFHLYRATGGADPVRLSSQPITDTTNFVDRTVDLGRSNAYFVRPVRNGQEQAASAAFTLPANAPVRPYLSLPLRTDLNVGARHVGVGDLTGDGEYDFVVKRGDHDIDPSQSGTPTHTYRLEGYRRDGTFLWRVDLGKNVRPGIWYSPFVVFDLDGDGRAEVITRMGDSDTDHTDAQGRDLKGPEFLVVIDGQTGRIRAKGRWIPRGNVSDWGDNYGNRVDRHLMTVAYLDGRRPSVIALRGTYTRMFADAWNWRDGKLTRVWQWNNLGLPPPYQGQGFHNTRVGDITGDGRDAVINGAIAIGPDGKTLWTTGEGHGDRFHLTNIDPARPGLEIFYVQEGGYQNPIHLRDARTGGLLWAHGDKSWGDVGRGLAADIDPRHKGLECWGSRGDLYNARGERIGPRPAQINMAIWWDDDLLRELLDGTQIAKWDYRHHTLTTLLTAAGQTGSRNAPMGYGDILGDWREEVWYVHEKRELRIYTTTLVSTRRFATFMHDPTYRISVAEQTMGYMQATQRGFYFGMDMQKPPRPRIETAPPVSAARLPTLFVIGDSTVNNGTPGQQGWGTPLAALFDPARIRVENRAIGGRSSRTFLTEGRWDQVLAELQPGDFVLIQFGHNDGGRPDDPARPRGSLRGIGEETQEVDHPATGKKERVHTYGWYLRRYITDAKARGATPIVLSPVPRNRWDAGGKVLRASGDYGRWAAEAAKAAGAPFIDLNEIVARRYEALGQERVNALFGGDWTHTNAAGAELNAAAVVAGIRGLTDCPLSGYLR